MITITATPIIICKVEKLTLILITFEVTEAPSLVLAIA